ncbi:MAG: lipid-A-disaccharide synthase [Kovacikia sp.]
MNSSVDILILSNGPGELATWVKPVVQVLRQRLGKDRDQVRISVALSPCANASGQEAAIARGFPEVDRVQGADHFFPFLLWGKTVDNWDWRSRGVVLFLGGDQFFPVVIAKRLGYRTVIYAEWEARWHRWVDRFGTMREATATSAARKYARKFTVVGDLMAEVGQGKDRGDGGDGDDGEIETNGQEAENSTPHTASTPTSNLQPFLPPPPDSADSHPSSKPYSLIGILPGSKPMKLCLGVPLMLAIAEQVHQARPHTRFVIPIAPALSPPDLAMFGNPEQNPVIRRLGWATAELVTPDSTTNQLSFLKTGSGLQVDLWTQSPAYDLLAQCSLCLTTVGANTAELGALAVPMIVILPTQQMDVMRAWDGLPGLLANLPGVGSTFATVINWLALRRLGLLAWPNIWAKTEIVPELVGELQVGEVAKVVIDLLDCPDKLEAMRTKLRNVRGQPGAAKKLVQLVQEELEKTKG